MIRIPGSKLADPVGSRRMVRTLVVSDVGVGKITTIRKAYEKYADFLYKLRKPTKERPVVTH